MKKIFIFAIVLVVLLDVSVIGYDLLFYHHYITSKTILGLLLMFVISVFAKRAFQYW